MNIIEQEDSRTHTIIVKTWKIIVNFKDDEEKKLYKCAAILGNKRIVELLYLQMSNSTLCPKCKYFESTFILILNLKKKLLCYD